MVGVHHMGGQRQLGEHDQLERGPGVASSPVISPSWAADSAAGIGPYRVVAWAFNVTRGDATALMDARVFASAVHGSRG